LEHNYESKNNVSQADDKPSSLIAGAQQEKSPNSDKITEHHKNHKPKKWEDLGLQDKIMVLLTFGILLIAGVTAIILSGQFSEMSTQTAILATQIQGDSSNASLRAVETQEQLVIAQKQANAAQASVSAIQRQMQQDQRPWIALSFVSTEIQVQGLRITENEPLRIPVRTINTGKTPARKVVANIFVEIVKNGESPKLDLAKVPPSKLLFGILFPNNPSVDLVFRMRKKGAAEAAFDALSSTEFQGLNSKTVYIAVYGRIDYVDVFNIPRWTKFCGWTSGSPGYYSAQACTAYNSVDTN
jgi:hypothetical protein